MADRQLQTELLDVVSTGILVWRLAKQDDPRSLWLRYANKAASRLIGFDLKPSLGRYICEIFPQVTDARIEAYASVCRDGKRRDLGYVALVERTATASAVEVSAVPLLGGQVATVFESRDALERAEGAARRAHRVLDSIMEQVPAMIFIKDAASLRFEHFNRAGEQLVGLSREQLIGKTDHDFFPKEQADAFAEKDREVLRSRALHEIPEEPLDTPHGRRWLHTRKIPLLDEAGEPRHLLGISMDITERREARQALLASHDALALRVSERTAALQQQVDATLAAKAALAQTEEQLRQSQKMEAIGRLAGGIAHDFNNLLSVVVGFSDLALMRMGSQAEGRSELLEIQRAGIRAAELTQQLLAFSRKQVIKPTVVDLNQVLGKMRRMLQIALGEAIELKLQTEEGIESICADLSQIEQIVMNLVVNARDAMPEGGRLTIATESVVVRDPHGQNVLAAKPGPYVTLSITDTGRGMDASTVERIFEPFFTTKEVGEGTGLGLSTVFGIVQQNEGGLSVRSEPGKGTSFQIYFPKMRHAPCQPHAEPAQEGALLSGHETVLLAEDDEQVRRVSAEILATYGYEVLVATTPAQALSIAKTHPKPIDLLLTDVVMPGMDGRTLAAHVRELRPTLRVLYMSGYTDDSGLRAGVNEAELFFLQKPLVPKQLAQAVRRALAPQSK